MCGKLFDVELARGAAADPRSREPKGGTHIQTPLRLFSVTMQDSTVFDGMCT